MIRITGRAKKIALFVTLGAILVGLAVALNVTWIVINWRERVPLVLGVIFFQLIIAGIIVYTIFLVRETHKNEHSQRREFYRIMLEDTDRLTGTVEQVLKAGEARQASHKKNWQEVDFSGMVLETVELTRVRHHLPPEQLRFGVLPQEKLLLKGNPQELRTAVFNLVENAVKYSSQKKDIVLDLLTPDIDTVLLQVRDQGVGIPHSELKRIFKRFYRVSNSATGRVKGTGLGLFIVRSIARRHGGDAFAESEGAGRGSTFTLRLPRVYHV